MESRTPAHARPLAALVALTLVGGIIRFTSLGTQSLWLDESVTASLLERQLPDMLGEIPSSESTPPLYYVLAWAWSRVVGDDPAGIRSLSALAGTLTIPVAYAAAAWLVSRRAGLAAAALATVSPVLVWFSQEARAYALLVLLAALSFALFARALERPSPRVLATWAVVSGLALWTHYFAAFLVAAEAVGLLLLVGRRRTVLMAVAGVVAAGVALAPLTLVQAGGSATWIRDVDLPLRVAETVRHLALPTLPPLWSGVDVGERELFWLWPLALVVPVVAVVAARLLGSRRERRGVVVALGIGVATVAMPLVLSVVAAVAAGGRGDVLLYRNLLVAWLPVTVAVAAGLTVRRTGAAGIAAVGVLVAASCAVLALQLTQERYERDDWRVVARALDVPRRVVVLSPSWQVDGLRYHVDDLAPIPDGGVEVDEVDVLVRRTIPSYSTGIDRLVLTKPFTLTSRERVQHWTLLRYRASSPVLVRARNIARVPEHASAVSLVTAAR